MIRKFIFLMNLRLRLRIGRHTWSLLRIECIMTIFGNQHAKKGSQRMKKKQIDKYFQS